MKWSLYMGKISGIKVFIHWTFLILLGWIFIMQSQIGHGVSAGLLGIAFIIALFACVIMHEFGHALTAKRFGIVTRDITIYPIGGVASLESMPENPKQELLVAVAGPAVNVIIAGLLWLYMNASGSFPNMETIKSAKTFENLPFAFNLLSANIVLVVFNLIPAFPMDGGRVLRALLAFKMDRAKATRVAAMIGQFLAILFVFFGFFYNAWLVFIGLFIYLGAGGEARTEQLKAGLKGVRVADVLMHRYSVLNPSEPLSRAVSLLLDSQEQSFIVKDNGDVKGTLSRKEIIAGLSGFGKNVAVENVMNTQFPRLQSDELLADVIQRLGDSKHSLMPVFRQGEFAGVLDMENVTEYIMIQNAIEKS